MKPLIIDIGSYALKIGFGGEFAPRFDIPMIAGKIRPDIDYVRRKELFKELNIPDLKQEYFFGHEAMYLRHILDVEWICNGRTILDEFFFLRLFVYAMDVLKISPTNQTILLTQPFYSEYGNFLGNKLFSAYNAYEIIPTFQPLLNCLAAGVSTGLVVDIGHFITQITPIINGVIIADGVRVLDLGGKDITDLLQKLLLEGDAFSGLQQSSILSTAALAETMKELFCYVSRSPAEELNTPNKQIEVNFPLLGGESVRIGEERFLAPETLFTPQKQNVKAVDVLIHEVVSGFDTPIQQALLGNILLTGGTSLLPGLMERLYEELVRKFANYNHKIKILPFTKFGSPRYSTFFGASKLVSNEIYNSLKISKTDYEYQGSFKIPLTFMETFNNFYEQATKAPLNSIIISVKNFYNSRLYQQIYNSLNSQRETYLEELGNKLQRSPFELYSIVETLLSYKIIAGELRELKFINPHVKEEQLEGPIKSESPVTVPKQQVHAAAKKEEPYVPSFQLYDTGGPVVQASKAQGEKQEKSYVPSFERYQTGDLPVKPSEVQAAKPAEPYVPSYQRYQTGDLPVKPSEVQTAKPAEPYVPSYQRYQTGETPAEPAKAPAAKPEEPYVPSYQRYQTGGAPAEPAKAPAVKLEEPYVPSYQRYQTGGAPAEPAKAQAVKPEVPYVPSFERYQAGEEPAEKAQPQPEKKEESYTPSFQRYEGPAGSEPQTTTPRQKVQEENGFTYEKIDKEMAKEWAKDDTIITEDKVVPRFKPSIPKDESGSFKRIDKEMEEEWKKTGKVAELKPVVKTGFFDGTEKKEELLWGVGSTPSFVKVDKEMEPEWKEEGKVLMPKTITAKGFFEQPTQEKEELLIAPTFLRIKDQEIPQPKKVMIADLLKPKTEKTAPTQAPLLDKKIPTFLQLGESGLSEEQLQQIKEFEEEERKKKEKEEKLL
ncbi:MAG: hypothetical protein LUQ65_14645 [Candidatus Helarchaeota archaeon]|nr:hypothetical protein [Candidatus Helarchaeota archaeon]